MNTQAVLEEAQRILLEAQIESVRVVTAFELHKLVTPSVNWQEARQQEEQRRGVKLVKYFR